MDHPHHHSIDFERIEIVEILMNKGLEGEFVGYIRDVLDNTIHSVSIHQLTFDISHDVIESLQLEPGVKIGVIRDDKGRFRVRRILSPNNSEHPPKRG